MGDDARNAAERNGADVIRLHPATGWQFWSWMHSAWKPDRYLPGELVRDDLLLRWEDTWCEPEHESGPGW